MESTVVETVNIFDHIVLAHIVLTECMGETKTHLFNGPTDLVV